MISIIKTDTKTESFFEYRIHFLPDPDGKVHSYSDIESPVPISIGHEFPTWWGSNTYKVVRIIHYDEKPTLVLERTDLSDKL